MRAKLIQATQNPVEVMWVAARTCYSELSPIELWEEAATTPSDKKWKLIEQVLGSGHASIAEHVYFTFAIEGISRVDSHQLVRHRHCTFSQKSQRYVEIKEDMNEVYKLLHSFSPSEATSPLIIMCNKYFVGVTKDNVFDYGEALWQYLKRVHQGEAPEDARMVLPNATKTDLVMSINLRELIHVSNLRLCTRAQGGIRRLFREIKNEVTEYNEKLGSLLVPSCEVAGYCVEHKSCGRKPMLKDLLS